MTTFVHVHYPAEHPGLARLRHVGAALKNVSASFDGAAGIASLLLAAVIAALLVVADQVMETWTDGNLLAAWIAMWVIAFAGLALLAEPARKAALEFKARHSAPEV